MKIPTKKDLIIATLVTFLVIGSGWSIVSAITYQSPEELRQAAIEARIKAMKADCKTIAERVSDCFTSTNKSACVAMQESYAWFTSQYENSPDFACSVEPDPLTFGAQL